MRPVHSPGARIACAAHMAGALIDFSLFVTDRLRAAVLTVLAIALVKLLLDPPG